MDSFTLRENLDFDGLLVLLTTLVGAFGDEELYVVAFFFGFEDLHFNLGAVEFTSDCLE